MGALDAFSATMINGLSHLCVKKQPSRAPLGRQQFAADLQMQTPPFRAELHVDSGILEKGLGLWRGAVGQRWRRTDVDFARSRTSTLVLIAFGNALRGTSHTHLLMWLLPANTFAFATLSFVFFFLSFLSSFYPSLPPIVPPQLPNSWGLAKAPCPRRSRRGAPERGQQWGARRLAPNPQLQPLLRGRVFERTCVMGRDADSASD